MSNASTIKRQIAGTQQLTLASLLGTTITTNKSTFQLNNNGLTGTGGGVIPLSAGVTGLYQGTGQVIWIHTAGGITGGTVSSTTLALELYEVPASVIAAGLTYQSYTNFNAVCTFSTGTLGSVETAGSFSCDAYVQLDAQGNLNGSYEGNIFGTITSPASMTPVAGLTGEADLNFVLAATLGGTETGVVITLDEFSLNLV